MKVTRSPQSPSRTVRTSNEFFSLRRARAAFLVVICLGTIWNNFYREETFSETIFELNTGGIYGANNEISRSTSTILPSSESIPTKKSTFLEIAKKTGTDKVEGHQNLILCLEKGKACIYPDDQRETCRPWGHFYDTIYDRWLAPYADEDNKPVQFLEVGYYMGKGFEAYTKYLAPNQKAELHSMEIACHKDYEHINTAEKHPMYQQLLDTSTLHCGDASDYNFLHDIWTNKMKRNGDGPPLKVVIDDGSHVTKHMAASLFFWFPRIEPGGILVVEDIQPLDQSNKFRTHIIPQIMKDLHWCGGPKMKDSLCFPQIQPFLQGVHCEMHICVFVRNDKAAIEPSKEDSLIPADAISGAAKCLFGPHDDE